MTRLSRWLLVSVVLLVPVVSFSEALSDLESRLVELKSKESSLSEQLRHVQAQITVIQNEIAQKQLETLAEKGLVVEAVVSVKADLFSEPSIGSDTIGKIPAGSKVKVLEYVGRHFYKVVYDSLTGYTIDWFSKSDESVNQQLGLLNAAFEQKEEKREAAAAARARAEQKAVEESIPSQGNRRVTLDAYTRLRTGMTYTQCCAIIGFWGTEISRSDIAGYVTVMYAWQNPDGSNMNAMFQNGQLVSKAQLGLR